MRNERITRNGRPSRRRVLRHGIAAAIGVGMARHGWAAAAPATPSVPAAGPGYGRPEVLIEPAELRELQPEPVRALLRDLQPGPASALVALAAADEHAAGRLPGSVQVDWPALEVIDTSDESIARWRSEVERIVAGLGITPETDVVAYDPGTLFATRLWWVLSYLGHRRVSVLHGGLAAWEAAGGEIVSGQLGEAAAMTPTDAPYRSDPRPAVLAQLSEVQASLDDPDVAIVDARTPEEYAAGHIPGAVNLNYPRNAQVEPPQRWLPAAELRPMYEAIGATPDKLVIPYCTSGVRSAVTFFTLHLLGYPRVALYTGSWQEWESLPDLPVVTGDQP